MELHSIDEGRSFDFGKTSSTYAAYRDIYPDALYERLRALDVAADGTSWLDLGTGTGVLPKHLYNPKARIVATDISKEQIAFARKEAEENGWNIRYIVSPAETTGLADHSFDTITAAQCFFYFDRDKIQAELKRLLKPGGVFVKIFMNWSEDDPIAAGSCAVVRKLNPDWRSGEAAERDMEDDLFPGRTTESFEADLPFTRESWHGRMRACRGTLASMDAETMRTWEELHKQFLADCQESFTIRHRIILSWFTL